MITILVIISLYGGIERVPMTSEQACQVAADQFNKPMSRQAAAYCIKDASQ